MMKRRINGEKYTDSTDIAQQIRTKIKVTKTYDVSFEYDSGVITEIIIK